MTTILYHKGILLADSRASRRDDNEKGSDGAMSCAHCGEQNYAVRDNSHKIKVPSTMSHKKVFRGGLIRAVACAGLSVDAQQQARAILSLDDYEKSYKESHMFLSGGRRLMIHATAMIVTDKAVYVINYQESNLNGLHADKYGLDEIVAIGSGAQAAKAALFVYQADPFQAMQTAILTDKSTGGPIRYVDLSEVQPEIRTYEPLEISTPECSKDIEPTQPKGKASRAPRQIKKPITEEGK